MDVFRTGSSIKVEGRILKRKRRDYMFVESVTLPDGVVISREQQP